MTTRATSLSSLDCASLVEHAERKGTRMRVLLIIAVAGWVIAGGLAVVVFRPVQPQPTAPIAADTSAYVLIYPDAPDWRERCDPESDRPRISVRSESLWICVGSGVWAGSILFPDGR